VAVRGAEEQGAEDQHVQSALQKIDAFFHGRDSTVPGSYEGRRSTMDLVSRRRRRR
jgi:hypothetical protein